MNPLPVGVPRRDEQPCMRACGHFGGHVPKTLGEFIYPSDLCSEPSHHPATLERVSETATSEALLRNGYGEGYEAGYDDGLAEARARQPAPSEALREAAQRLSDAIADQVAVGTDGLFGPVRELDARAEYLAALKALRTALTEQAQEASRG